MSSKLLLFVIALSFLSCKVQNVPLYVGSYTNGESQGIYKLVLNTKTGELNGKALAVNTVNPSYLTYSPDKKYVYAVNENEAGMISSFKVEADGRLTMINSQSTQGAHPCHVSVDGSGKRLVVSNYTGGNAAIYNIKSDGSLSEAFQIMNHNKGGIPSHVHSGQFYNNNLYVSDLGKNAVYRYQLENEIYHLKDSSIVAMPENAGPRHFALTKNGQFIYIINEHASSITTAKMVNNEFELINHTSTLSEDYKDFNACADIHLSKDERYLYASNRGENSIAVFSREPSSGKINMIQNISVHGDWPRNFSLDPTGKYLLVANQKSNNIAVFRVDAFTGKLSLIDDTKMPSPVCLLFYDK